MSDRFIFCGGLHLVFWCATLSAASDVHCKMKPGCTLPTQCDPIPKEQTAKGYDLAEHLFNKEFPITCSNNEINELRNEFLKDIEDLKTESFDLKTENEMWKKTSDGIQEKVDQEIEDLKTQDGTLKRSLSIVHKQINQEFENLKQEDADLYKQNKKLDAILTNMNAELHKEIENLKQEDADLYTQNKELDATLTNMNEELNQEIEDLKIENLNLKFENKIWKATSDENQEKVDQEIEDLKIENINLKSENNKWKAASERIQEKVDQEIEDLKIENLNLKSENKKWKATSDRIQEKVDQEIEDLKIENRDLQRSLNEVRNQLNQVTTGFEKKETKRTNTVTTGFETKRTNTAYCPIPYNNKCYVPDTDAERSVDGSRAACKRISGKLANIYSKAHMDFVMRYIRSNHMAGASAINLWTDMSMQPRLGRVRLSDGRPAPYLRWDTEYPQDRSYSTNIVLRVNRSPSSRDQYMWNNPRSSTRYALCEI